MSEIRMVRLAEHHFVQGDDGVAAFWRYRFMIRDEWDLERQEDFDEMVEWCRDQYGPQAPFVAGPFSERWVTDELLFIFFNDEALAFEFQNRWC